MAAFRLALINPNTDEADTTEMARAAGAALGDGAEVVPLTARRGVAGIETSAESLIAAAETLALVRETPDADAYLIACFGDPGLDGVREVTDAPVIGIGEATYHAMASVSRRFAVITTLRRGIPALLDGMEHYGVASRCVGVLASEITVEDLGGDSTDAIVAAGRRAVDELGAEALALACGGMTDLENAVRERVGVPATNGVAFGALLAHALWRSGLRTSTVGSLAPPPGLAGAADLC
ncbi:MAG TPA: aspartate/glutamate racemase family protein [Solirubrobacteraceae bacterium]|nr:aspartate/glutamate racemase family protein [Solirubrobacteraceae bacterium]